MAKNVNWQGLCKKCDNKIFTMMAKNCPECKIRETNSCWKRCKDCAKKQNKCANCDKPLSAKAMKPQKFATGALPPPHLKWTIGLTVASTAFVDDATKALTERKFSRVEKSFLTDAIEQVKSKKVVLMDWLTVDEFLTTGELPS